jgi:Zn-dependent M28 family amino/carboxypeptidase
MRYLWIAIAVTLSGLVIAAIAIVTQPLVTPGPAAQAAVDPARLEAHVRQLSETLHPRSHDQFANIDRAARYVEAQLLATGARVSVQDVVVKETTYRNIIARFGPDQGPVLIIGAHYDSHGDAAEGAKSPRGHTPESHTPGADDNASGTAGLIELARLLVRSPPPRPVELVAYTLEEPPHFRTGHMGSAWHARSLKATGRPVDLMLSLEMIGYFSDAPGSQNYPVPGLSLLYPDRGDFLALVGRLGDFGAMRRIKGLMAGATDLPVRSINAPPMIPGVDFSDHLNYWAEGYPAIMVTDTAFMRNHAYHQAGDTADRLDYVRMAKVVQAVFAVTRAP